MNRDMRPDFVLGLPPLPLAAALWQAQQRKLDALMTQPSAPLAEDELDDWDREMAPERVRRARGGRFVGL